MSTKSNKNKRKNTLIVAATILTVITITVLAVLLSPKNPNEQSQLTPTPGVTSPVPTETPTGTPTETPSVTPSPTPEPTPTPTPSPTNNPTEGEDRRSTRKLEVPVKALYLNNTSVRNNLDHYIDLANKTEINAYVIDIKDDTGKLMYDSNLKTINDAKADTPGFDIREVTKKLHDNNIIVIARMVTFKDSTMTKYNPDLAIKTESGNVFITNKTMWLDATKKGSWDYLVSIAKEAVQFGFDEIQFDYIRFPETSLYDYKLELAGKSRHEYIEGFIRYARESLPSDTILSADVFGMPLIATKDYGEIGQSLETIGGSLDYICPMIYPSHFANNAPKGKSMGNGVGQIINGVSFTHPDLKPYEVVYNTLMVGKRRVDKQKGYNLNMRTYIQGFTAGYLPTGYWKEYGVAEYQAQMKAIYDAGYTEWIFWNSPNKYVEAAFKAE